MSNNLIKFWNGPFSQWHLADIRVRNWTFNCCEQYMMSAKAAVFGDDEAQRKIIQATDPREQKRLGREVKGYDDRLWKVVSREFVFRANMAKFTQHDILKKLLLEAGGGNGMFVEASPYDKLWGIGLSADDPRSDDPTQWQGENWLGQILTVIRNILKNGNKY